MMASFKIRTNHPEKGVVLTFKDGAELNFNSVYEAIEYVEKEREVR